MRTVVFTFSVLLIAFLVTEAFSLVCLHCKDVLKPRYCRRVSECQPGEVCSVTRELNEFGEIEYNIGCMASSVCTNRSSVNSCRSCCQTDLCNNQGCGETGWGDGDTLACYNCQNPTPTGRCHDIHLCPPGEICQVLGMQEMGEQLFISQCLSSNLCFEDMITTTPPDVALIVGRRNAGKRSHDRHTCTSCCTTSLCNTNSAPSTTQSTTQSSTVTSSFTVIAEKSTYQVITAPSPVHGVWGAWTEWSCSVTCGQGISIRHRKCNNPAPAFGGGPCEGQNAARQGCTVKSCAAIVMETPRAADCSDVQKTYSNTSGVYTVTLWNSGRKVNVYCDMTTEGGGWTVFQRRINGLLLFYRNFSNYENGFGDAAGEYWLGLTSLQEMVTRKSDNLLRIDVQTPTYQWAFDEYDGFSLAPGPDYNLSLNHRVDSFGMGSSYELTNMEAGMPFSTFDHDLTSYCTSSFKGAWWYKDCFHGNLNGLYKQPGTHANDAMIYSDLKGFYHIALRQSKMMFR